MVDCGYGRDGSLDVSTVSTMEGWKMMEDRKVSSRFVVGLHGKKVQAKVHQFW
jgi:hypothetical protein